VPIHDPKKSILSFSIFHKVNLHFLACFLHLETLHSPHLQHVLCFVISIQLVWIVLTFWKGSAVLHSSLVLHVE